MSVPPPILAPIRQIFESQQRLGDRALAQVAAACPIAAWHAVLPVAEGGDGGNSLAVLIRHLQGNMRSRWTDFLTSDGEKNWRERDNEFRPPADTPAETLLAWWREGWQCLYAALEGLSDSDLARTVTIRQQPHTVAEALLRQLSHYAYHVGQLVQIARWQIEVAGTPWESLSIPRDRSATYTPRGTNGEPPMGGDRA